MESIAMLVLWILANVVYVDMRRQGEKGFKRLVAFWLGWPGTFVGMLSVDEGSQPAIRSDDRNLRELVKEVRMDRHLRSEGSGPRRVAAPEPESAGAGGPAGRDAGSPGGPPRPPSDGARSGGTAESDGRGNQRGEG